VEEVLAGRIGGAFCPQILKLAQLHAQGDPNLHGK
jgi:hypothetical protein